MADSPAPQAEIVQLTRFARSAGGTELANLLHSRQVPVLEALLENPALRETHLLILLARRDLPRQIISAIGRNPAWMRTYPMKLALVKHPLAPRQVVLPLLKHIYLFDLLAVVSTPGLSAELRRISEDTILLQASAISLGQRVTLAHRGNHRIAAGMLLDPDGQVVSAALENPALTDLSIAQALVSEKSRPILTESVLGNGRWMSRRPVQLAILRSRHLSLAKFAALLPSLTASELADLRQDPRLPRNLRDYVGKFSASRGRTRSRPLNGA